MNMIIILDFDKKEVYKANNSSAHIHSIDLQQATIYGQHEKIDKKKILFGYGKIIF